ncbi:MAG: NADH-quinone oxidoreductase subunit C [Thaumarchaeota archaeon]|nr:NADH-quinone oxidoreductase subunit C [Nitrososphaerota archaeon]MCL5318859.1 NADH-quinone oxidoreductase subunit C [Nitrososphaerota archaeon]
MSGNVNNGITKYTSIITEKFGEHVESISEANMNELHVTLKQLGNSPKICEFIYSKFHARLSTMVCSDERRVDGGGYTLRYVFSMGDDDNDVFIVVTAKVDPRNPSFPSIALQIPAAFLYEREIKDMFGLTPQGNPDMRPLILHEEWPSGVFPLRMDFDISTKIPRVHKEYQFIKVEGEGVCEIPVGPVHAGIIEPGHFRFSILGEHIVNLETRLFYTHKGVEKLAENRSLEEVLLLAERISGDESVANSTAYCQAVEKIAQSSLPKRAEQLRVVYAEMERIYNHLGTLAGISTDVGYAYGSARLNILKERMMRLNEAVTGSRLLFGVNRIGGVTVDVSDEVSRTVIDTVNDVQQDFEAIIALLRTKSSFIDRLRKTGVIPRKAAKELGIVGVAARCAGLDIDVRHDHPYAAYSEIRIDQQHDSPRNITKYRIEMQKRVGDALSRFEVRVEEIKDSMSIIGKVLRNLSEGEIYTSILQENLKPYRHALGYAESHRGETMHWLMLGEKKRITRYKVRTASFSNWPIIEQAVLNDIIPDFPLVNKSLDLSYSGNDL